MMMEEAKAPVRQIFDAPGLSAAAPRRYWPS
jgi:hypothetical protein